MQLKRGDIKRFREHLNYEAGAYWHTHRRFGNRTRKYGDWLYFQDREKFMVDLQDWLNTNPAVNPASR